ncbi:hypothetical protein EIN_146330 [Entamoeba invadens IP1]|uniref:RNA ligase domain-containing protein n=1 Tax=Entamoeba invadens IP1 TaxID=370355 RepID=L7FNB2_ENTIV|nr:hypothetical protein EIN_146330 [Entamoeba invadens IP1]ELP87629.1 hypothetical protein EIN_146330 [Entamoeba invadens IP1]|eukprot:XP_004254400.1 hypothetical protein EIN_146330 [Entamoeba invadens IP1]
MAKEEEIIDIEDIFVRYDIVKESENELPYKEVDFSRQANKTKWVVTEKIHGSNFSLYYTGKSWRVAKRNSLLTEEEMMTFFGCSEVIPKILQSAPMLLTLIKQHNPHAVAFVIYGELCGGNKNFPGSQPGESPDVPVQVGILYSPKIEFIPFDMDVIIKEGSIYKHEALDFDLFIEFTEKSKIGHVPVIKVCDTVDEALSINLTFDSLVPKQLGYTTIVKGTNQAEGVVIKPYPKMVHGTKSVRESFKRKHPKFKEIEDFELPRQNSDYVVAEANILARITKARLQSFVSKNGVKEDLEVVQREVLDDVLLSCSRQHILTYNWWFNQGGNGQSEQAKRIQQRAYFKIAELYKTVLEEQKIN